jgi:hypothetical protein
MIKMIMETHKVVTKEIIRNNELVEKDKVGNTRTSYYQTSRKMFIDMNINFKG